MDTDPERDLYGDRCIFRLYDHTELVRFSEDADRIWRLLALDMDMDLRDLRLDPRRSGILHLAKATSKMAGGGPGEVKTKHSRIEEGPVQKPERGLAEFYARFFFRVSSSSFRAAGSLSPKSL